MRTLRAKIDAGELCGGRKTCLGYYVDPEQFHAPPPPRQTAGPLDDITDQVVRRAVGI